MQPRDASLQRIRNQLLAALGRAPARGDTRAARATLAATSSLTLGLQAYTRQHPQFGALVPD